MRWNAPASAGASRRPASDVRIFVSAALYGKADIMLRLLADVERHIAPALTVLHVSVGSHLNESRLIAGRQLLNPESLRIMRYSGAGRLAAHLRNWAHLERHLAMREPARSRDKVAFLAANQRLFRDCRPHIMAHEMSFSLGQTTDFRFNQRFPLLYPSSEWEMLSRRVAGNDDRFFQNNGEHRHFVRFMRNLSAQAINEGWRQSPLTYMPHEGSFYPVWLLRQFATSVYNGSVIFNSHATLEGGSCGWHCRYPEEQLLPTFVWQRHPQLLRERRNGPPFVSRAWVIKRPHTAAEAFALSNLSKPARSYICGLKLSTMQIYTLPEGTHDFGG